jgi:hypothetical protein
MQLAGSSTSGTKYWLPRQSINHFSISLSVCLCLCVSPSHFPPQAQGRHHYTTTLYTTTTNHYHHYYHHHLHHLTSHSRMPLDGLYLGGMGRMRCAGWRIVDGWDWND